MNLWKGWSSYREGGDVLSALSAALDPSHPFLPRARLHYSNCERSELLIWEVHQFELGCIKLHTPYRYKVHPILYSLLIGFLRIESTTVQRCVRKSTEFASGSKIVDENTGDMENFLVTQDSTRRGFC